MSVTRVARIAGTGGALVAVSLAMAMAQTQSPLPSTSPTTPPAATAPEASPPAAAPQATPSTAPLERKFAAPAFVDLVGLSAKSSDGHNLGTVHTVIANPGGKTTIGVKVGGFLGFGGHMVAIPDGKFNRVGDTVQINMTGDEIHKLPQAVEQK